MLVLVFNLLLNIDVVQQQNSWVEKIFFKNPTNLNQSYIILLIATLWQIIINLKL